jgi:flavorubredoxin
MVTYLNQEKILFSNDAFGSLVNSNKLYDDMYEYSELIRQAKEYYANIVMPCNRFVEKKLNEINSLNLEFDLICPSHGVIWRSHVQDILDQYMRWAIDGDAVDKVVIVYDTIWDNTQMITDEIAVAIASHGYEVRIFNASKHRKSLIMSEIMDCKAVLVGSSNFNNTMTPSIADVLERMIALKPRGKYAMAFGSYGWADVHLNRIEGRLKEAGLKIINQSLYENYTPDEASLIYAASVGDKVATKLREMEQND